MLKKEIWGHFGRQQNVFLATVEGDQPRLRPVTLFRLEDRLFVATGSDNAKVKQIRVNPKVEFCLMFGEEGSRGTIRAECTARIVKDKDVKAKVYGAAPLLSEFWENPEEPSYTLIELLPIGFEYYRPNSKQATKIKL